MKIDIDNKKNDREFTEVELLELKAKQKVGLTLSMLAAETRMRGTLYFRFNEYGPIYQLKVIEDL